MIYFSLNPIIYSVYVFLNHILKVYHLLIVKVIIIIPKTVNLGGFSNPNKPK